MLTELENKKLWIGNNEEYAEKVREILNMHGYNTDNMDYGCPSIYIHKDHIGYTLKDKSAGPWFYMNDSNHMKEISKTEFAAITGLNYNENDNQYEIY